jgi:hypothetical protein
MTDKPEIKVGQRWLTTHGSEVFIIADNAQGDFPFVGQYGVLDIEMWNAAGELGLIDEDGYLTRAKPPHQEDLVTLLPPVIRRQVALYRCGASVDVFEAQDERVMDLSEGWRRISELLAIEFTLLPGESA